MAASDSISSRQLAWLEGTRILAVVMILLYQAQLLISDYAYSPQPIGLWANLQQIGLATQQLGLPNVLAALSLPFWFGFQWLDVLVLLSGFTLALVASEKPLSAGAFLRQECFKFLWALWTVVWLSYPILAAIGIATGTPLPNSWFVFAGATFPLLFAYDGSLLISTNNLWWFIPLLFSFILVFPALWQLQKRWGPRNLAIVSLGLTLLYRALAVYEFEGCPPYVFLVTPSDWLPFLPFVAKLSTFVLGMVTAQAFLQGRGMLFWTTQRRLAIGIGCYAIGFVAQFSHLGWVFADLLLPIGLVLVATVVFQAVAKLQIMALALKKIGPYYFSYFLIQGLLVERAMALIIQGDRLLYWLLLPSLVLATLVLAVLADHTTPLVRRLVLAALRDVDYVLSNPSALPQRTWHPQVGNRVSYRGETNWLVLKVERLLDEREVYLCQISNGQATLWADETKLELLRSESFEANEQAANRYPEIDSHLS